MQTFVIRTDSNLQARWLLNVSRQSWKSWWFELLWKPLLALLEKFDFPAIQLVCSDYYTEGFT